MKKAIGLFLILTLIMIGISYAPVSVNAQIYDVTGINDTSVYYIRNSNTGHYLTVTSTSNNAAVVSSEYNGLTTQKWKVARNSDGSYFLYSIHVTNKVMNVSGSTNITTYNSDGTYYQRFILERVNGRYKIKYQHASTYIYEGEYLNPNYKVSLSASSPYNTWCFELATKGDADIYSFDDNDYDSSYEDNAFESYTGNMGYTSYAFKNYAASTALLYMQGDQIWVHNGHGGEGFVYFMNSAGNSNGTIDNSDINNLVTNKLAGLRMFITTGCSSGENTNNNSSSSASNNLIYAVYEKGAHFAIGWKDSVNTADGVSWIKTFFYYSRYEYTVRKCIEYADFYYDLGAKTTIGDDYQKLN